MRNRIVGRDLDQALEGLPCGGGVADLLQEEPQASARSGKVRPPLGQHLEVRQGGDLALADQPRQGRMRFEVVALQRQEPAPGVHGAGAVFRARQRPAERPPCFRLLGLALSDRAQMHETLGGIGGQLGQGLVGLEFARCDLERPAPGRGGLVGPRYLGQDAGETPPRARIGWAGRLGCDPQRRNGVRAALGQQVGEGLVGLQVPFVGVLDPAPGLDRRIPLAGMAKGPRQLAPRSNVLAVELHQLLQASHGVGVAVLVD